MTSPPDDTNRKSIYRALFRGIGSESPAQIRNVLLIVATLIAAVTFQTGVNPPGGVWQENGIGYKAGQAIYASNSSAFYIFLTCNTLALSTSIFLIISLTYGFPFYFEVLIATLSMALTYGSAIFEVTPDKSKFRWLLFVAIFPFASRILIIVTDSGGFKLQKSCPTRELEL